MGGKTNGAYVAYRCPWSDERNRDRGACCGLHSRVFLFWIVFINVVIGQEFGVGLVRSVILILFLVLAMRWGFHLIDMRIWFYRTDMRVWTITSAPDPGLCVWVFKLSVRISSSTPNKVYSYLQGEGSKTWWSSPDHQLTLRASFPLWKIC